jgi:putative ABC transport system permease protein
MNRKPKLPFWLQALFRKRDLDADMQAEMRAHIEMQTRENIKAGMGPEEARSAAFRQFGGVEAIQETCREQRGILWLEQGLQDIQYGWRTLRKSPGFTAVAVLTLALGLGASTAIYSVVNALLLNPLPGPAPARLREIVERGEHGVSADVLAALRANQGFFSDSAWFCDVFLKTRTDDFSDAVLGAMVSPNFFSLWTVGPLLGRTFARDEAVPIDAKGSPERDAVMVLEYSWWKSRFAGDRGVIGRTLELGERRFTVIGVMPAHFQYPPRWRMSFWVPAEDPRPTLQWGRAASFGLLVRLQAGVGRQQTQAMLDLTAQRLAQARTAERADSNQEWRQRPQGFGLELRSCRDRLTTLWRADDLPRTFYGLLGAIGFVLLIVCLNVANLTLARTERRQQELAVRAALGAGRARLARQLVTEAVLLTCLGGAAGLAAAAGFTKLLLVLIPPNVPRLKVIGIDGHALGFALLVSAITGVALGLASARHAGRARLNDTLKQAGSGATVGRGRSRYGSALVVMEVALSLVLLAGAGLMIQSVVRLLRVDPGYDPENLLWANLWLPSKYSDSAGGPNARPARNALFDRLQERLAAVPGVKAVGIWGGWFSERGNIRLEGRADLLWADGVGCGVEQNDFLRVMRVPLRAGHYLKRSDSGEKEGDAVINESMARLCWPGQNALGQRFRPADSPGGAVYRVAGVVADVRPVRLTQGVAPTYYRPYQQANSDGAFLLVIRTERDPRGLVPTLLRELKAEEPDMHHPRIEVARQDLEDSTQAQRTFMFYLVGFAGVGLLLAALGIYGVLAYSVARRAREIGIRLAVGGQRRDVLRLVMWEGARLVGIGAALGLLGAFWLLKLVKHLLFQVPHRGPEEGPVSQLLKYQLFQAGASDPRVWSAAVLLLLAIALLACWLPARRATRIDPMEALRCE